LSNSIVSGMHFLQESMTHVSAASIEYCFWIGTCLKRLFNISIIDMAYGVDKVTVVGQLLLFTSGAVGIGYRQS